MAPWHHNANFTNRCFSLRNEFTYVLNSIELLNIYILLDSMYVTVIVFAKVS